MTNQLSYSDWPLDNKKNRSKTIKNCAKKLDKNKFKKMLNKSYDSDSDSESDIADFTPPPKAEITKRQEIPYNNEEEIRYDYSNDLNYNNQQYNNNKQYNNNVSHPFSQYNSNNDELLAKKINYMINLLEEQKDVKTKNITEELILYCFLGIFIIFLIDSFVKIGKSKYTR